MQKLLTLNHNLSNILLGMFSSSAVGHLLHDKDITNVPLLDVIIKIGVPIVTGIFTPIVKEWIETRKEKRRIRNANKKKAL